MVAGIWDCLSSQDVIDFVRYQVSKGKELTEIGGMICDHCLAPDLAIDDCGDEIYSIGCDNMTVVIVAITHGRSKEGWYTWIKDRVEKNYGYETPSAPPKLYSESRLEAFRANEERRHVEEMKAAQRKVSTSSEPAPSSTGTC